MLRAKKPTYDAQRFKAFIFGGAKIGKTWASIQFPAPYLIDTEGGMKQKEYVDMINSKEGVYLNTYDFDIIYEEIKLLMSTKHSYKTIVIDSLTVVYDALATKAAIHLSKDGKDGTEFGRHYAIANQAMKKLILLLFRIDMNVIITAQSKPIYNGTMEVAGETFDCFKKLPFIFDLVMRIERFGVKERRAFIMGSRIRNFPELEFIPFSYEEIAQRYPIELMEKDALPEVLASESSLKELKRLIGVLKIEDDLIEKWLTHEKANFLDEISEKNIQKYIDGCLKKLNGE